jgi:hypothetical protein
MKKFYLGLMLALSLSACASFRTVGQISAAATTPVGSYTVMDEKAMYAAEVAYNVPAQAYRSADSRGLLSPVLKGQIKTTLQTMRKLLLDARAAYKLGAAASFGDKLVALQALRDHVTPLIPK